MNELKKAAILSYIKLGITNIGGILITPYIIKMLGDSEYGLYTLIGAFVGYLSILDLGLNNAIVRYVAQYRVQNDKKGEENFLAVSLLIYMVIGVLLVVLGSIFYFNIEHIFGSTLDSSQLEKAKWMLLVLIFNIGFTLPGGAFTGICTAYEAFLFPRWLDIIKYIIRIVLIVSILKVGADSLGIVILDTVLNLVYISITIGYVYKKLKVTIKFYKFDWLFIREIFGYSIWIFVFGIVYQFQWRTGQVILGTHMTTVTVAIYGIGVMLGIYFTTFGNIINQLILPKAVKSVYENTSPQLLTEQMTKVGRVSLMLLLFVFGGFVVIGKDFIQLWVGPTYANSWYVAVAIMFVYLVPIAQGYAHSILEAKKLLRFKSLSFLIASCLGMVLGGFLSYPYGELGMIAGLVIPLFILQWIIMNVFYKYKLGLNINYFIKNTISIFELNAIIVIVFYIVFQNFEVSCVSFLLKSLIYSITFFVALFFIMNDSERQLILKNKRFNKH
jgi:O-antigen/teichoic acid export membrane protein